MIVFCPKTTTVVFLPYKATLRTGKRYPIGLDLTKFSPYRATLKTQIGFSSYEMSQLVLTLHSYSQNTVMLARVPLFPPMFSSYKTTFKTSEISLIPEGLKSSHLT